MPLRPFLLAPLLFASTTAIAQTAPRIATDSSAIQATDVRRILSALADDSMQGRRLGTEGARRAARYIAREMAAIGLKPAGDSGYLQRVPLGMTPSANGQPEVRGLLASWAAFDSTPADQRVVDANVIGILPGTDTTFRDSIILVDAHYDHLGIGRSPAGGPPVNGDSVYNGADDDASGVVTVLSVARALAKGPRPKRTIVFLLTTGEEHGLEGAKWYMAHPFAPIEHMAANLEIEMTGRPDSLAGGSGRAWLTGDERSTMGANFRAAGLPIVADPRPDQQFFQRSDNIAFARAGVVAQTLSTFNLHSDYHQVTDDVSHVDIDHMTAVARVTARAVRLLADGPPPVWNPGGKP